MTPISPDRIEHFRPKRAPAGRPASKKVKVATRASRKKRRGRAAAAALVALTLGLGLAGAADAIWGGPSSAPHGEARLFFPPWIAEAEVFARISRAGGVAIAEPGGQAGSNGLYRAITAQSDFAARARSEGALFVLF